MKRVCLETLAAQGGGRIQRTVPVGVRTDHGGQIKLVKASGANGQKPAVY